VPCVNASVFDLYENLGSYWLEISMFYVMSRVWTHCEEGQGCAARVFVLFARSKRLNWGLTTTKITMVYNWHYKIWWGYRRYYTKLLQMTSITFCLFDLGVHIKSQSSPPLEGRGVPPSLSTDTPHSYTTSGGNCDGHKTFSSSPEATSAWGLKLLSMSP
jgi:hypothetical protein